MKNKILYAFIFALSFIFIGIGPVNAETTVKNFTGGLKDMNNNPLPFFLVEENFTTRYNTSTTWYNHTYTTLNDFAMPNYIVYYNSNDSTYYLHFNSDYLVNTSTGSTYYGKLLIPKKENYYFVSTSGSTTYINNNLYTSSTADFYSCDSTLSYHNNTCATISFANAYYTSSTYYYNSTVSTWTAYNGSFNNLSNHAAFTNIIYSTNNVYSDINKTTIYRPNDYIPIPDINVDISISSKLSNGSYDVTLNIIPAKKGWYVEIEDILSGYTTSFEVEEDLQLYGHMFMNIVDNTLYEVKIYNNSSKEILYYQNSFNAILNEEDPHIKVDSFKYNEDNSYTLYYHYENTTANNKCYYALYDLDWVEQSCSISSDNFTVQHNGLFGLKIVNIKTSEIVDQYMLNLIPDKTAVYMTFGGTFMINTMSYNFKYNTFNYNITDYLYYSTNGTDWIYLDDFVGYIDFYTPQTLYFKLEDSSHVIKYQTIYELTFNSTGDYSVKDTKNFLEDMSYYISNLFDALMTLYANINSEIKVGIVAVVPMIILCIFVERWRK